MRYDAFTRTIYTQYRSAFDRTLAAALGILLVLFALSLVMGEGALRNRGAYHRLGAGSAREPAITRLGRWRWLASGFCALIPLLALGVPIATLIYWVLTGVSTDSQLQALPRAAMNSVLIGFYTAVVATLAALPVAILAVRYRRFLFSRIIERISYLGYALPGIVIALVVRLSRRPLSDALLPDVAADDFRNGDPLHSLWRRRRPNVAVADQPPIGGIVALAGTLVVCHHVENHRTVGLARHFGGGRARLSLRLERAADHVAAQPHRIRHPRHRNLDRDRWRRVWSGRGAGARADRDLRDSHPAAGAANLPACCDKRR